MSVTRRILLGATVFAPVALAGCATLTGKPNQIAAQVLSDVNLVASGLANALPGLQASNVVPAAVMAKAQALVGKIQASAASMSATISKNAAQPIVTQIEQDVNAFAALLAGLPLPPPYAQIVQAAVVLLPVIEIGVGLAVPAGASHAMTPAEARLVLKAA